MRMLCGAMLALFVTGAGLAMDRGPELLTKALALTPDATRGRSLYESKCATCHGERAWGRAETAIPALAGQRELYLLRQLADVAALNRDVQEMHRLEAILGAAAEQQWRDVAAWLAAQPLNPSPQRGDGRSLDVGSGIYRDACAQCHGDNGEGDDAIAAPAVAGQHYSYLLLQTRGMAAGHRFSNLEPDLGLMLSSLSAEDMSAVADYMSRLGTAPATASTALP